MAGDVWRMFVTELICLRPILPSAVHIFTVMDMLLETAVTYCNIIVTSVPLTTLCTLPVFIPEHDDSC